MTAPPPAAPDIDLSPRHFVRELADGLFECDIAPGDVLPEPTIVVPGEHVLLLTAQLPLPTSRQRIAALPFAIEEQLAEPLGDMHIVLGPDLGEGRYLAAAVRHEAMQRWTEELGLAGLGDLPIVPGPTLLPIPPLGWLVEARSDSIAVRTDDGTGFGTSAGMLAVLWAAAGRPPVALAAGTLAAEMAARAHDGVLTAPRPLLDLRTGQYAPVRAEILPWRRLATVIAAGALLHLAIFTVDSIALAHNAEKMRAETEVKLAAALPAGGSGEDLFAAVAARLSSGGGATGSGTFVPVLAQASAALMPLKDALVISELAFTATEGLTITLETADFAALQQVKAALADAGLNPVSGTARATSGGAEAAFTVQGVGAT